MENSLLSNFGEPEPEKKKKKEKKKLAIWELRDRARENPTRSDMLIGWGMIERVIEAKVNPKPTQAEMDARLKAVLGKTKNDTTRSASHHFSPKPTPWGTR